MSVLGQRPENGPSGSSDYRILVLAYACEPGKGSEPGVGWAWARMLTRLGQVTVVTRANNRESIQRARLSPQERERLRFVYVDLPRWARLWKRGQGRVRLYYLIWQALAVYRARRLQRDRAFHVAWHVTLSNAWLGSLAPLIGIPFVFGPVGGGVSPPWRLLASLGWRGGAYEILRASVRAACRYANPFARLAWRRAGLILAQNPETVAWFPTRHRGKAVVFQHAVVQSPPSPPLPLARRPTLAALFAGRLLPWKGAALAISSLALIPKWRLIVCGSGPDERRLKDLARKLGLDERVEFRGWAGRDQLLQTMREEVDIFLFPSLHDDASIAVSEAISCGLPVVSLDRGGPHLLAGEAGLATSASGGAKAISVRLAEVLERGVFPSTTAVVDRARALSPDAQAVQLEALINAAQPGLGRTV